MSLGPLHPFAVATLLSCVWCASAFCALPSSSIHAGDGGKPLSCLVAIHCCEQSATCAQDEDIRTQPPLSLSLCCERQIELMSSNEQQVSGRTDYGVNDNFNDNRNEQVTCHQPTSPQTVFLSLLMMMMMLCCWLLVECDE